MVFGTYPALWCRFGANGHSCFCCASAFFRNCCLVSNVRGRRRNAAFLFLAFSSGSDGCHVSCSLGSDLLQHQMSPSTRRNTRPPDIQENTGHLPVRRDTRPTRTSTHRSSTKSSSREQEMGGRSLLNSTRSSFFCSWLRYSSSPAVVLITFWPFVLANSLNFGRNVSPSTSITSCFFSSSFLEVEKKQ